MNADVPINLLREALTVLIAVSLPILLVGLVVGLVISLVQAATQVQESSLVFVPKLLATCGVIWLTAPWTAEKLVTFVHQVFEQMAQTGAGGL